LSSFTVDAAAALDGPDWLRAQRVTAAERFVASGLPSSAEEVWRYSRIDELDLDAYSLLASDAAPGPDAADVATEDLVPGSIGVLVVDGRVVPGDGAPPDVAGVEIATVDQISEGEGALGSVAGEGPDAFADLNIAFGPPALVIRVAPGRTVDEPIVITHRVTADGAAVFPRVVVQAGNGSGVTVLERYASSDVHALVCPVVEIDAARAARVAYVGIQELGPRVWQVASQVSSVGQEATFLSASAALGGDYARLRSDCRLTGRGASGELLAAYFGEAAQTLDFRTFQDHRAPDTTSNLLFKGAVGGHSRSVYTGLIRVRKEARGTNAFQTNRNIKLSDHAWAESVPNLEIENNDVHCSHASAVGPVDDEQRFYLESRGVPPRVAERLVVAGFFDEVLTRIPVPAVLDPLRDRIAGKLDRREQEIA